VRYAWSGQPPLLRDFSLDIQPGAITAIVGPSGSGKSTLLRLAAHLLSPAEGRVEAASERTAFVFQSPNLLPWRTVRDNVALPLQLQGTPRAQRRQQAEAILARVGLADAGGALPGALSGGMKMRASLARALVTEPGALLMDEPFSSLDTFTRRQMHAEFLGLWQRARPTVLLVTHDLEEATLLADRVVLVAGRPLQVVRDDAVPLPRPRARHDSAVVSIVRGLEQAMEAAA